MSIKLPKLNAGIWLLLGLVIGVVIGLSINKTGIKKEPMDVPIFIPGRVVNITIDQGQRDELFAQLNKFAEKWNYAIRIAPVFEESDNFHIGLWRTDIKVIGAYISSSDELQLAFTDTESTHPTPDKFFDEEIQDLKNFMDEIPNSTFTFWTPPAPPQ